MGGAGRGRGPHVSVGLLGGLRVESDGALLDGARLGRRVVVTVARLAVESGGVVSSEAIADALWGERWPTSWRSAVRNVVSEARRSLSEHRLTDAVTITSSPGGYALGASSLSVDVLELSATVDEAEAARAGGDLDHAGTLAETGMGMRGEVLPGRDEPWVGGLRARVAELRRRLAHVGADAALGAGQLARAEQLARAVIDEAPLREDGHRLLIRALWASGNRAAALSAYEDCRRLLAERLGAVPAPETERLWLGILAEERGEVSRSAARTGVARVPATLALAVRASPFVGRQAVLDELEASLDLALSAGALLVSVVGEPGAGKTRLAAELALRAAARGIGVAYGRADDRASLPHRPLLEAVEALDHDVIGELDQDGSTAAQDGPVAPTTRSGDETGRLPLTLLQALHALADRGTGLVVLDDLQWDSRATVDVLEAVVAGPEAFPVLVLALERPSADRPDGVARLLGRARVERIELGSLSVEEVAALARSAGVPGAGPASALWRRSGGNPLVVHELLRARPDTGGGELPVRVGAIVGQLLSSLPRRVHDVLGVAAVAGIAFDPGLVASAIPVDLDAGAALDAAVRAGLLVASAAGPGWLEFRHGLVRDHLLDDVAPEAKRRIHARLGSTLEQASPEEGTAGREGDVVRLA